MNGSIFPIGITLDLNHFLDLVVDQWWYRILSIYSSSVVFWWARKCLNFILVIRRVDNAGTNWCKSRCDKVTISRRLGLPLILKRITVSKSLLCTTTFATLFIRIIKKFVNILGAVEAPWSMDTGLTFKLDDWSVISFSTKWLKQGLWIMLVRVGYDI